MAKLDNLRKFLKNELELIKVHREYLHYFEKNFTHMVNYLSRYVQIRKEMPKKSRKKIFEGRKIIYSDAKDSMDRFCDDITEVVLSFLTFEEKFHFECVSKQWQRVVFANQLTLEIRKEVNGKNTLNGLRKKYRYHYSNTNRLLGVRKKALQSVLKKCRHIKTVCLDIPFKTSVLMLFGKYCPLMRELKLLDISRLDEKQLLEFGSKYGQRLRKIICPWIPKNVNFRRFLALCPNIEHIFSFFIYENDIDFMSIQNPFSRADKEFLPHLREIELISFTSENIQKLDELSEKYSKSLRTLSIAMFDMIGPQITTCIEFIARMESLRSIGLFIESYEDFYSPIDESLSQLVKKALHLKHFRLVTRGSNFISESLLLKLNDLKTVEKLKVLMDFTRKEFVGSVKVLEKCQNLRRLTLGFVQLNEYHLEDIQTLLPNLQFLHLESLMPLSDPYIASFRTMRCLQKVKFIQTRDEDWIIKEFYFGKRLKKMNDKNDIELLNTDCGLIEFYVINGITIRMN